MNITSINSNRLVGESRQSTIAHRHWQIKAGGPPAADGMHTRVRGHFWRNNNAANGWMRFSPKNMIFKRFELTLSAV